MLDRPAVGSRGDTLALTEISAARQLLLAQPDPELTGLALVAVQRDHLAK